MESFQYTTIDRKGSQCSGQIQSLSRESARDILEKRGHLIVSIDDVVVEGTFFSKFKNVSKLINFEKKSVTKDEFLRDFTKQMLLLMESKIPLNKGLALLVEQESDKNLKKILDDLLNSIKEGKSLSVAMGDFPEIFPLFYIQSVRAGESGFFLEETFRRLLKSQDRIAGIRKKVKLAALYPSIVLGAAVIISLLLALFVVPKFEQLFYEKMGHDNLPILTRGIIYISSFIKAHFWEMILLKGIFVCGVAILAKKTKFKEWSDYLFLLIPKVNKIIYFYNLLSFCKNLGVLIENEIGIIRAIDLSLHTVSNKFIRGCLSKIPKLLEEGYSFSQSVNKAGIGSSMMINLLKTGENTGRLSQVLEQLSSYYEDELDGELNWFLALMEPALVIGLAISVGLIVIGLFLPLSSVIQHLSL